MRTTRRTGAIAAGAAAGLLLGLIPTAGSASAATTGPRAPAKGHDTVTGGATSSAKAKRGQTYDINATTDAQKTLQARAAAYAARNQAQVAALRHQLGVQGVIDIDSLTGTPRQVARTDGFLTGPSTKSPKAIVLDYVRSHQGLYGLDAKALATLKFRKDYVDILGTHHLSWVQVIGGKEVVGHGLQGHVTKKGQLVSVVGSPLTDVTPAASASLTPAQAGAKAVAGLAVDGAPAPTGTTSHTTSVAYLTAGGLRSAYQTQVRVSAAEQYLVVVDGITGRLLYRRSLTQSDNSATVWEFYPGAKVGGSTHVVDLSKPGWLPESATKLSGPYAHVFSDVNDDNAPQASEEVTRTASGTFRFPFKPFTSALSPCTAVYPCSWDPATPNSWQVNRKQNAVQVFYYVNKYHDHLKAAPIGFTAAAGNFEGKDAVSTQPDDGANTANGLPDGQHVDNANMSTPPDGQAPTMQMYLFHQPGATYPSQDPFIAANGGDEADVVYHEYTHGLSSRLVVDASGNSTLSGIQAGAMGEAWSDWYAFDFLANQGILKDTSKAGELRVGDYVGAGQDLIRTQPIDCPVNSKAAACHGTAGTGPGGYTYGDFAKIIGRPEVHASGEIWAETLWEIRSQLGATVGESIVTRAMELSPSNPSFLDERNAILQADRIAYGGKHLDTLWGVFARRGMGYFAGTVDGDDTQPVEDFSLPPRPGTVKGPIHGVVTDTDTKAPLAGAMVYIGGHHSGFSDDYAARTNSKGQYAIGGVYAGTYPKFVAFKPGWDRVVNDRVKVGIRATTVNFTLRRDWISARGGATVTGFTGPDYTSFRCGPLNLVDQSQGAGWVTDSADDPAKGVWTITPKSATYRLPAAVNVTSLAIDPAPTCGLDASAGLKDYRVETSADGTTWTVAVASTFAVANQGVLNPVAAAATGVRYVRFTMVNDQVPGDFTATCSSPTANYTGCFNMGTAELEVYGTPAA